VENSGNVRIVAVRVLHAPPPQGRVEPRAASDENEKTRNREHLHLLFLPVLAVRNTATCKTQKKSHKQFYQFLSPFFYCVFFLSIHFQRCKWLLLMTQEGRSDWITWWNHC